MATQTTSEIRGPIYGPLQPFVLAEDEVRFDRIGAFARRHFRLLSTCVAGGIMLGLLVAFMLPKTYTARASFVPQGRAQLGALASIAAQFGVAASLGGDATRTPSFYTTLLNSKNLLSKVVEQPMPVLAGRSTPSLEAYLGARGDTPGERRESAIKKLLKRLAISVDQKAGMVVIEVQLRDAAAAQSVARELLAQIDTFNLRTRQSQASSERRFTEGRLAESQAEMRAAESQLLEFLQSNRDFRSSPQLTFTYDRLTRDVTLKQQIYTTLAQAYEQARIEEVRDTPVITVVEDPLLPARPDPAPWGRGIAGGIVIGLIAAILIGRRREKTSSVLN